MGYSHGSPTRDLPTLLRESAGIMESDQLMRTIMNRYQTLSPQSMDLEKTESLLTHLRHRHCFTPSGISLMIQRLPDILISPTSIDSIDKVMDFLSSLGLSSSETREVAVRVPQVLTYSVTQHLIPHRAVLLSLLPEAQAEDHLRDLVNSSPQVLSPSIDAVILHFTRRRVPRRHIGRLLKHSTVIEYLIPTLPLRATAFDALSSILFADSKPRDEPDVYPL